MGRRGWTRVAAAVEVAVLVSILHVHSGGPAPVAVGASSALAISAPVTSVPAPDPAPTPTPPTSQAPPAPAAAPRATASAAPRAVSAADVGAKALARITYPWASLGYQLAYHGPRDGFFGLTDCTSRHIDIYVMPDQTVTQVQFVTAFEIAHAVDCTRLSSERQTKWAGLRGFHLSGSWFPPCSCSEDAYASGDFAEVFARWQAGPAYPWRSTLAPAPTASQLPELVRFLES
jgi:hypothetical protein